MTIETKYNIGDEVWFVEEGDVKCEEIFGIEVNVYKDKLFVEYLFANDSYPFGLNESALFHTKEELLNSLYSMSKGFDLPSNTHLGNSHDYWLAPQKNSKKVIEYGNQDY